MKVSKQLAYLYLKGYFVSPTFGFDSIVALFYLALNILSARLMAKFLWKTGQWFPAMSESYSVPSTWERVGLLHAERLCLWDRVKVSEVRGSWSLKMVLMQSLGTLPERKTTQRRETKSG